MFKYRLYQFKRWFGFFKFNFIRFFNKYYESFQDDIKEIELMLENVDMMCFQRKHIGRFDLSDIKTEVSRIACNSISTFKIANQFILEVKKDANIFETDINYGGRNLFDRIVQYGDICSINIIYKTGKSEHYYFDYDEGDNAETLGANNINQKSRINQYGDLELVISKTLLLDCFPEQEDVKINNLRWEMYE